MTSSTSSQGFNLLAWLGATLRFTVVVWIFVISSTNAFPFSGSTHTQGRAIEDRFWVAQYDRNNQIAFQKVSSVHHKPSRGGSFADFSSSSESDDIGSAENLDTGVLRAGIRRTKITLPTLSPINLVPVVQTTKVKRTKLRRRKTKQPPVIPVTFDRPLLLAQLNAVIGDISAIAQNCV